MGGVVEDVVEVVVVVVVEGLVVAAPWAEEGPVLSAFPALPSLGEESMAAVLAVLPGRARLASVPEGVRGARETD